MRNAGAQLFSGKIDLVLAKLGARQNVLENPQHFAAVFPQHGEPHGAGAFPDLAGHDAGDSLHPAGNLVPGLGFRPAGDQRLARDVRQPNLVARIKEVAGPDHRRRYDQGQVVVLPAGAGAYRSEA